MFEKASRLKLRFQTSRGMLSVEDLWDVKLTSPTNGLCLDSIAKGLSKKVKASEEESFVVKKSKADATLVLMLNIVKHIIDTKLMESDANEKRAMTAARKQQILEVIADKKDEGLRSKSVEELEKMLED